MNLLIFFYFLVYGKIVSWEGLDDLVSALFLCVVDYRHSSLIIYVLSWDDNVQFAILMSRDANELFFIALAICAVRLQASVPHHVIYCSAMHHVCSLSVSVQVNCQPDLLSKGIHQY